LYQVSSTAPLTRGLLRLTLIPFSFPPPPRYFPLLTSQAGTESGYAPSLFPTLLFQLTLPRSSAAPTTRLIPFLSILSVSCSPSPPLTLTIHALVPSSSSSPSKKKPHIPLKLWKFQQQVVDFQDAEEDDHTGAEPTSRGASPAEREGRLRGKVEAWCKEAEEKAYAGPSFRLTPFSSFFFRPELSHLRSQLTGVKRKRRLHCIVNPAGGKGFAKRVWEETVKPIFELAGAEFDVSCAFSCSLSCLSLYTLHSPLPLFLLPPAFSLMSFLDLPSNLFANPLSPFLRLRSFPLIRSLF
jgi:hypothetical protein